jgi:hypothetical protein
MRVFCEVTEVNAALVFDHEASPRDAGWDLDRGGMTMVSGGTRARNG